MCYRFILLLWLLLTVHGEAAAQRPLSPEAKRVQAAYARLRVAPKTASAQLAYLKAFPATKAAFLRVFSPADSGQLYSSSDEHVAALQDLAGAHPQDVLAICFGIGKHLSWEADAVGYLQHATVEIGVRHPRTFAAEARKLMPADQLTLFQFLADVENHRMYTEYTALMKGLTETGAADLAAKLEKAKQRRMKQPNH